MTPFRQIAPGIFRKVMPGLLTALVAIGPAAADICRSIEAELAALSRPPSPRERQAAAQAAYEAQRLRAHMGAIGCDRQPLLFLGPQPPAECRGYRAQLARLHAQAAQGPDETRRRQLAELLASNGCAAGGTKRSPSLAAGLYDEGVRRPGELSSIEIDPGPEPDPPPRSRTPAGKAVCVRTCDGYFFPLHQRGPGLAEEGDGLCQSLCPGAETRIYFMQGAIETAVSAEGEPYANLDNALRYRKRFDPACSCQKATEGPAVGPQPLNPEGRAAGGFDLLDGERADEDVPLRGLTPSPERKTDGPLFKREPPSPPPDIAVDNLVTSDQGETRTVRGRDGVTRTFRVIGPPSGPVPSAAGAGAAPGRAPAP